MGFVIKINGEKAWESEGDHVLVNSVTIRSAQGEAGKLSVPNSMQECDIIVEERDTLESDWLDVQTRERELERASEIEEKSADRVTEGRKLQEELDKEAAGETEETPTPTKATGATKKEPASL